MATRRIRSTINNKYVQPLKLAIGRKIVLAMGVNYNSVLFTKKHKAKDSSLYYRTKVWAKFNGTNFDGIHMTASLTNPEEKIANSASCNFNVYYVDASNNWSQTLVYSTIGTLSNKRWIASATQAQLGSSTELDGERTLMIEATITRLGKEFKSSVYVNHLGIYDSLFRLKEEVEFLFITKKDE